MKEITIFYSWQSDLPDSTNRKKIRDAIHLAIPDVEGNDIKIILDEATRDEPGSPYIPGVIIDKIKNADIFIGDLTIINKACNCGVKKTPNPNVVFELGFAVAHLGWKRIIMLVNSKYTDLSKDLPFDFDRHRATKFTINLKDESTIIDSTKKLSETVYTCISSIINNNPIKESNKYDLTPDEIRRNRDLSNIKMLMSTIHQPTLQDHIQSGPRYINDRILYFWESFNGVFSAKLFYLYDTELYEMFKKLHEAWNTTVSFDEHYHITNNPELLVFANPMDMPLNKKQEKAWNSIESALVKIDIVLSEINDLIRRKYLEIDINEMNKYAWIGYVSHKKRIIEELEEG